LDDFGAVSPADNPCRSVFVGRCNRIATGVRVRGVAVSESMLRQTGEAFDAQPLRGLRSRAAGLNCFGFQKTLLGKALGPVR